MKASVIKIAAFLVGTGLLIGPRASGAGLNLLVSSGDVIDGFTISDFNDLLRPSINDAGTVAFSAGTPSGHGTFTQYQKLVHTGDVLSGLTLTHTTGLLSSINASGDGVYGWEYNGTPHGVFIETSLVAKEGDAIGGKTITVITGNPVINDSGAIVFRATAGGTDSIFSPTGIIAKPGDVISGRTLAVIGSPAIDQAGTVAFHSTVGSGADALFTQNQMFAIAGDTVGSKTLKSFGDPDISAGKIVAYATTGPAVGLPTGSGLFVPGQGFAAHTGDIFAGKTLTDLGTHPTINEDGLVSFRGTFAGGSGIFAGSTLLAQTGDVLDGKTIASFGEPDINDFDTVAFFARFSDGSGGIVVATIPPVPEPSSFVLAAIATLGALAWVHLDRPLHGRWVRLQIAAFAHGEERTSTG